MAGYVTKWGDLSDAGREHLEGMGLARRSVPQSQMWEHDPVARTYTYTGTAQKANKRLLTGQVVPEEIWSEIYERNRPLMGVPPPAGARPRVNGIEDRISALMSEVVTLCGELAAVHGTHVSGAAYCMDKVALALKTTAEGLKRMNGGGVRFAKGSMSAGGGSRSGGGGSRSGGITEGQKEMHIDDIVRADGHYTGGSRGGSGSGRGGTGYGTSVHTWAPSQGGFMGGGGMIGNAD